MRSNERRFRNGGRPMNTVESRPLSVIIVGTSHAAVAVATELRTAGYTDALVLVGEESGVPYHRPHLSKEGLTGDMPCPKAIKPESFYAERNITLRLGTCVTGVDRDSKTLFFAGGGNLFYDILILATGAHARRLPTTLKGADNAVILRDKNDWEVLAKGLLNKRSLAVIGGGLIGLEVAAAAREKGLSVTVIESAPRLMARTLYPEIASIALHRHQRNGIDVRLGVSVSALTGQGVTLADGSTIEADLVLACIGSDPRTELARAAHLPCSNGVDTDACGRTMDPAIFAIGDCANWDHKGTAIRHESIPATLFQARAIAAAITGKPAPAQAPLRLWSFQGTMRLQMSGQVLSHARTDLQQLDEDSFLLQAFDNDRLIALQAINAPRPFIAALGELESDLTGSVSA